MLDSLFEQFLLLRTARIAHGSVNGDAILVDRTTSTVALLDFRNASSNAQVDRLNRDLAGAVASTALAVGPERTAAAAVRCLSTEVLLGSSNTFAERARPSPRPTPARQDRPAERSSCARFCRGIHRGAEVGRTRRVSVPTLILAIGTLVGGWALIGTLINVTNSFDTIVGRLGVGGSDVLLRPTGLRRFSGRRSR